MGRLLVQGYLATDIRVSKYGYYFVLKELIGESKVQFHNVFINEKQRDEMEKEKLSKSSYVEVMGNQKLDIFEKAGKPFLSSVLNYISWKNLSSLKEEVKDTDIKVIGLEKGVLPY